MNGRIEAARASGGDAVLTLFRAAGEQVQAAQQELQGLEVARVADAEELAARTRVRAQLGALREQLAAW